MGNLLWSRSITAIMRLTVITLALAGGILTEDTMKPTDGLERQGKLFLVSSTTSTSTVTTTALCWKSVTNAAINAVCAGRKKRELTLLEYDIESSQVRKEDESTAEDDDEALESGITDDDEEKQRNARFLLYWATTTSTTTTTSITGTSTLASIECTPSSFTINECG